MAGTGPNDRILLGCIGVGRQGRSDMQEAVNRGLDANARLVAVCDVDSKRAKDAVELAKTNYQKANEEAPKIDVYGDFRELLARKDIDGVVIVTPDHWHALIAIEAAKAGKDIYLEKPMTNTIAEGQALIKAVRDNKRVFQLGSQQRSNVYFRKACELVRNGKVGNIHTIRVRLPEDKGTGNAAEMPVPENLNYDLWLGPAEKAPYTQDRVHPQDGYSRPGWLQTEPYCHGMITGWGAHMLDIAQWGNGTEDSGLVEIEAKGEFPESGVFNVHTTYESEGKFSNGVKLFQSSGEHVTRFEGDEGWIEVSRDKLNASDREILKAKIGDDGVRLYESKNHMLNFLECMRSRKDPVAPVEVGHRSNSVCVVTHIAMKLGRKLNWDPKTERFKDDNEANAMVSYKMREPWSI
jgi:myo-inositol 2-dehydrogenase/D-chiro-inositol 1-dehydrogenase